MFGRRRSGGGNFGLFLLAMEVYRFLSRTNRFYPVMLGVLALNVAVHLRPGMLLWPSTRNACISASKVWLGKKWQPLFYSAFTHGSDTHLYFNMVSFMWKAASLEERFGSAYLLYMTTVFTALTGVLYVAMGVMMAELSNDWSYMQSCAVGFSGVIFALKVVTTHLQPPGMSNIMGIPFPSKLACWAELVLISVLVPNSSFMGHLAGILVGLAFVWGPLKFVMDIPWQLIGSFIPSRNPRGVGGGGFDRPRPRYNDSARATGYRNGRNSEEEELQEAIRRSRDQHQQEQQDQRRRYPSSDSVDSDPRPPTEPPPAVNPSYSPYNSEADIPDDSSGSVSTSPDAHSHSTPYPEDDRLSGMPMPSIERPQIRERVNLDSRNHDQGPQRASDDKTTIRAARLRRFGRPS